MSFSGSISIWIEGVKAGCETAATNLWTRYRGRLMGIARRKLRRTTKAIADEEDVAVTAFHSFIQRCRNGAYSDVHDRDDLWRLLMTITVRKASNQVRDQNCSKRRLNGDDVLSDAWTLGSCDDLASGAPPLELMIRVSDSLNHLLSVLSDGELRSIVIYKLEGYSNDEVAAKIGRSVPTVERRLRLIREKWREEFDE